jgi:hypothetical protein
MVWAEDAPLWLWQIVAGTLGSVSAQRGQKQHGIGGNDQSGLSGYRQRVA